MEDKQNGGHFDCYFFEIQKKIEHDIKLHKNNIKIFITVFYVMFKLIVYLFGGWGARDWIRVNILRSWYAFLYQSDKEQKKLYTIAWW